MNGLVLMLLAAVVWGVGSFASKVAVATVDPWTAALVRSVVFFPVVAGYVATRSRPTWDLDRTTAYGLGAGVLTGISVVSTRVALTAYDVSVVSPVKRLGLLVTVLAGVLLFDESLTARKVAGVVAAVVALFLLS